jgi:hypothetical protein
MRSRTSWRPGAGRCRSAPIKPAWRHAAGPVNAALNLARMAQQHAQAEGNSESYVARTGRETQNARRGQLRPGTPAGHSPLKREDPTGSTQARKGVAVAA